MVDGQLVLEPKVTKVVDPINESIDSRLKEGSLISVVANKAVDKKKPDMEPTKLSLKGGQPQIRTEIVKDESMQMKWDAVAQLAKAAAKQPDPIEASIDTRI